MTLQLRVLPHCPVVVLSNSFDGCTRVLCTRVIGWMLLACIALVEVTLNNVAAQEFDPESNVYGRKIFIQRTSHSENSTVLLGETVSGISVERVNPNIFFEFDPVDRTQAYWTVEPAGAAQIITPMPVAPLSRGIEVQFLEPGTVTLTAYGFEDLDAASESNVPGFNTAVFTFNVVSSMEGEQAPTDETITASTALTGNARSALTTVNQACDASLDTAPDGPTTGQAALQATCDSLALQDDPANDLGRLVPEEFFALGDALTVTADNQISNVQSRINNVRTGQRSGFDISSLKLKLWDQTVSGSVLAASKNALWQFSGGGASQDSTIDSALGLFANGNISVGSIDGKGIQRDADISTNSLTVGADYRIDHNRVVGAALGIVNDTTDFKGANGEMDMQGIGLSAFGTWYEHDSGYADIVVDVGQHEFDLTRRINLVGQSDEFAKSTTDATRFSLSINVGRTFQRGATEFGPVGRITMTRAVIDGFSETSLQGNTGSGTTLKVKSHTLTSARFSLGGEIKRVISTPKAVFVPSLRIEIENESETDKGDITTSFINDPDNNQMLIEGAERDSSAWLISIGSTAVFARSRSAFVFFETRAQDDHVSQNRVRVGYRMHF